MEDTLLNFAIKGLIAFACGAIIGLERELKGKPAGLRTSILICIGSTLFTAIGFQVVADFGSGDPTRVFAQIITGVGFLGAGSIIQRNGSINGLTTASTIWITSAIGVAVGVGYEAVAIWSTIATVLTLVLLRVFENKVLYRFNFVSSIFDINIEVKKQGLILEDLEVFIKKHNLTLLSNSINSYKGSLAYQLKVKGHCRDNSSLIEELSTNSEVIKASSHKL